MKRLVLSSVLVALLIAAPAPACADDFDPHSADLLDAIDCRLTAAQFMSFGFALEGEDGIVARRGWAKVETKNAFLAVFELPSPITVAGSYMTRRIAFASGAVLAVLDLADPSEIARVENVRNLMDPDALIEAVVASGRATREQMEQEITFRKFMGERVISDVTDPPDGDRWRSRQTVARSISNVSTDPGKTLYGCAYRLELLDKDGRPL
ncbi:hypothetical protein [Sphingomonas quercus]|uniref:hypothetical protein n=1 Tax=Sphingomonas quercus TaxID=2842451 RepID=UPI00209A70FD|nr:hypothetical protein [Sphingomonas quercus]